MKDTTRWLWVCCLLLAAVLPRSALAYCYFDYGTSWSTVTFTPPAQIMVPNNTPVGTVLWSSPMTSQNYETDVTCSSWTSGGIFDYINAAQQPAGGSTIFPTNVPGIGIRLARGGGSSYLIAAPNDYITSGTTQFNLQTSLQFIVTGSVATGQSVPAGQLLQWNFGNLGTVVSFGSSSTTTFTGPACTVATDPTVVMLPTVTNASMASNGATTGDTPFTVQLDCSSMMTMQITLDSTNPVSVNNGVLRAATGSGTASGVGVQLLSNGSPAPLRKALTFNATQGSYGIPFTARYYRTGTVKAGSIAATATYTLTYP